MFLRNKIAILSFTLMSLMTIPTLAENDTAPVTSRIENANFDVQIKTPEGWSETKDFTSIPETFSFGGQVYKGLQFKNGSEHHGCVVFFTEDPLDDDEEDDDDTLVQFLAKAQSVAFPGSTLSNFSISKVTLDGSFAADIETEVAKVNVKGTIEGSVANETGDPSKLTITGTVQADSTKGNVAVGTGTFSKEGAMPLSGTTGVHMGDEYEVIVAIWGTEEDAQVRDTYRFLEAVSVKKKAPAEEPPLNNDAVVASEPVAEEANTVVIVTESVVIEVVKTTPVVTETPVVTTEASA
jgi:hypothetical protein